MENNQEFQSSQRQPPKKRQQTDTKQKQGSEKRVSFSHQQKEALKEQYHRGMTSIRDKQKIAEVSQQLGVSAKQVEVFIGNYRRKQKGTVAQPAKKKPTIQGPNGYSFFCSKLPKGSQDNASYFRSCSQKWCELPGEQKEQYKTEAAKIRQDPNKGLDRDALVKHHFNVIQSSIDKLDELGYNIGGLAQDSDEPGVVFGTKKCFPFFKSMLYKFEETCRGQAFHPQPQKADKNDLETEVRKIFKTMWCEAVGKPSRLPYNEILRAKTTEIEVEGLPAGVKFDYPSNYGIITMEKIISSASNMSIRIIHQQNSIRVASTATASISTNQSTATLANIENIASADSVQPTTNSTSNEGGSREQPPEDVTLDEQQQSANQTDEQTNGGSREQPPEDVTLDEQQQSTNQTDEQTNEINNKEDGQKKTVLQEITNTAQLDGEDLQVLIPLLLPNVTIQEEPSDEIILENLKTEEQETDETIYSVEKVLKRRKLKGRKEESLVKWENFDQPTWIPSTNFVQTNKRRRKKVPY